jgi:hypothetical protein
LIPKVGLMGFSWRAHSFCLLLWPLSCPLHQPPSLPLPVHSLSFSTPQYGVSSSPSAGNIHETHGISLCECQTQTVHSAAHSPVGSDRGNPGRLPYCPGDRQSMPHSEVTGPQELPAVSMPSHPKAPWRSGGASQASPQVSLPTPC